MRIFVSSAGPDRGWAAQLRRDLEAAGHVVWTAEESLRLGSSIFDEIASAISAADAVIVLLSSATSESQWVATETALALAAQRDMPMKKVIPIRLDRAAKVPVTLRDIQYLDMSDKESYAESLRHLLVALTAPGSAPASSQESRQALARVIEIQDEALRSETANIKRKYLSDTSALLLRVGRLLIFTPLYVGAYYILRLLAGTMFPAGDSAILKTFLHIQDTLFLTSLSLVIVADLVTFARATLRSDPNPTPRGPGGNA